jgi:hypothetical protein
MDEGHPFKRNSRTKACWCGKYASEHWPGTRAMAYSDAKAPPCYENGCQPHCFCLQIAAGIERLMLESVEWAE